MDESRLDFLEGRVEEQSKNWERLFADIGRLDQKIDGLGAAVSVQVDRLDQKIDALGVAMSVQVGRLDQKIDGLGSSLTSRIDSGQERVFTEIRRVDEKLDTKFDGLRGELTTQFRWTIGIMTALMSGVLAAILTR